MESQLGINLRKLCQSLLGLPKFFFDYIKFRRLFRVKYSIRPCLGDHLQSSASIKNEYFFQDLYVARQIFKSKPIEHIDVGSRVDGFVAHVASFMKIKVLDIRPQFAKVENIEFIQQDLTNLNSLVNSCHSISCLHALEHFGLGRYGDNISQDAFLLGLRNLASMLAKNGLLYLSIPIGIPCIYFNSHRVSSPTEIIEHFQTLGCNLVAFAYYHDGKFNESSDIYSDIKMLINVKYALGIFTFRK